jgi:hypothetical protein
MKLDQILGCIKYCLKLPYNIFIYKQVCLDYWNLFVLELFETYNQVERLLGLQVCLLVIIFLI